MSTNGLFFSHDIDLSLASLEARFFFEGFIGPPPPTVDDDLGPVRPHDGRGAPVAVAAAFSNLRKEEGE